MQYTIKAGDNLTKIAREQYGLQGNEAYKKALEIAKANNIKNPNLIYTGNTLNLCDTLSDKKNTIKEGKVDNFEKRDKTKECDFVNTYQKLTGEIRKFQQNDYMNKANQYLLTGEYQFDEKTIPTYEKAISFVSADVFSKDATTEEKIENYKKAALEFARQEIDDVDKENAEGKKDGLINYDEFKAKTQNEYKERYENLYKTAARNQFIQVYVAVNGKVPTENEIQKGLEDDVTLQNFYNQLYNDDDFYKQRFESMDIDDSKMLDSTELAANIMFMDAFAQTNAKIENSLIIKGDNDEAQLIFDGVVDIGYQLPGDEENQLQSSKETISYVHKMFFGQTNAA